jgi:hypothetical protein
LRLVQGDQIGCILARWAIVFFEQNFQNYVDKTFLATFYHGKVLNYFGQKWVWIDFGRFFSQTHLVALVWCLVADQKLQQTEKNQIVTL